MRTTVNVPKELLDQAVAIADARSQSEAVRKGLEELVARGRIKTFLDRCGTFGFELDWQGQRKNDARSSR